MLESKLVKKVSAYCKTYDILYINLQSTNISGIPDSLLIDQSGNHFWFELKREDKKGRLSPIQKYVIDKMTGTYNCTVNVVDSLDEIKEVLNVKTDTKS